MKIKKHVFLLLPLVVLAPPLAIVSCSSNSDSNENQGQVDQDLYNPAGGNVNNLQVDKYLNVVKKLDLKSNTKLVDLNNQGLTQKIQKYDSGALVEILTGSTSQGNLSLKLTKGNNEEVQINIKGFEKQSNVVFTYSDFKIDEPKWVENLLSVQTSGDLTSLESVSSEVWTKVIKDFKVQIDNATNLTTVENTTYIKLVNQGVKFSFSAKTTGSTSNLKMKISAIVPGMLYQNGSWVSDPANQDQIEQLQPDTTTLNIPPIDIVKKYVIDKTTVDESVLPNFYPSALQAAIEFHKKKGTNFIWGQLVKNDLLEKAQQNPIMQKYFKGKTLKLAFDLDKSTINDWTNALIFNVNLELDGKIEKNFKKEFEFYDKNKSINKLSETSLWDIIPTVINLNENSEVLSKILKELKGNSDVSSEIDDHFKGQDFIEKEINIQYDKLLNDILSKSIYEKDSNDSETEHKKTIDKIKKNFDLKLLNKPLEFNYSTDISNPSNNQLMYSTGLFNFDNNIFQIKKIDLVIQTISIVGTNDVLVNIKPSKNKKIEISFEGEFNVKFNQWVTKTFGVIFKYELDQNKWNSIQATP